MMIALFFNCSRQDKIIIQCGSYRITQEEFLTEYARYQMQPHTWDNDSTRIEYAKYLMNRKLLAQLAESLQITRDTLVIQDKQRYMDYVMREYYIRERTSPLIPPLKDSLCRDIFTKMNESRQIRHLVTRDSTTAWAWYNQLQQKKISFEKLAEISFRDTLLQRNGGLLGLLNWDQLDYPLAQTAFTLQPPQLSPPIKSKGFFHILRVDGIQQTVFKDENSYQISKKQIYNTFKESLFRYAADSIVQHVVKNQDIQYDHARLNSLDHIMGRILSRQPVQFAPNQAGLREDEMQAVITHLHSVYDKPVASCNGELITVRDLVTHLPYLHPEIIQGGSLEILGYYLRDKQINRLAYQKNLQHQADVKKKVKLYQDNIYGNLVHTRLIQSITVTPQEIEKYYIDHQAQYKTGGIPSLKLEVFSGSGDDIAQARQEWLKHQSSEQILQKLPGIRYQNKESVTHFSDSSLYAMFYLMPEGEISSPIAYQDKYWVGKILSREAQNDGIEYLRSHIQSTLLAEKRDSLILTSIQRCKPCKRYRINEELIKSIAR